MDNSIFAINNIIEDVDTQETERIVWIDSTYSYCYTIDMIPNKTRFRKRLINNLEEGLAGGVIKKHNDTKRSFKKSKNISNKEKEIMDKAQKAINYIFNNFNELEIYSDRTIRANAINMAVQEAGFKKKTRCTNILDYTYKVVNQ